MGAGASAYPDAASALADGKTQEDIDQYMMEATSAPNEVPKSSAKEEGEVRVVTPRIDPPAGKAAASTATSTAVVESASTGASKSYCKQEGEVRLVTPRVAPSTDGTEDATEKEEGEVRLVTPRVDPPCKSQTCDADTSNTASKSSGKEEGEVRLVTPRVDPPADTTEQMVNGNAPAATKTSGESQTDPIFQLETASRV
jgi:hypothetical protein